MHAVTSYVRRGGPGCKKQRAKIRTQSMNETKGLRTLLTTLPSLHKVSKLPPLSAAVKLRHNLYSAFCASNMMVSELNQLIDLEVKPDVRVLRQKSIISPKNLSRKPQ